MRNQSYKYRIWKNEYARLTPEIRCFNIIKKVNFDYISAEDFKPIMNSKIVDMFITNMIQSYQKFILGLNF